MTTTHGLPSTYRHGCRCEDCRVAHTAYTVVERAVRAERLAADPTLAPHGKRTTYTNWGCRCALCVTANTQQDSRKVRRERVLAAGGSA